MRGHGFPGYERHRKEHAALTATVVQVIEHTQECDKLYGLFPNRRGVH